MRTVDCVYREYLFSLICEQDDEWVSGNHTVQLQCCTLPGLTNTASSQTELKNVQWHRQSTEIQPTATSGSAISYCCKITGQVAADDNFDFQAE